MISPCALIKVCLGWLTNLLPLQLPLPLPLLSWIRASVIPREEGGRNTFTKRLISFHFIIPTIFTCTSLPSLYQIHSLVLFSLNQHHDLSYLVRVNPNYDRYLLLDMVNPFLWNSIIVYFFITHHHPTSCFSVCCWFFSFLGCGTKEREDTRQVTRLWWDLSELILTTQLFFSDLFF